MKVGVGGDRLVGHLHDWRQVMHALWDFPLVTIKGLGQGHVQISWGDVLAQFFENGLMIAVGLLLVWMGDR